MWPQNEPSSKNVTATGPSVGIEASWCAQANVTTRAKLLTDTSPKLCSS
jgi:hypothetical protein